MHEHIHGIEEALTLPAFLHDVLLHPLLEFAKLLPLLFLTYLLMEFLEHKAGEGMEHAVARAGRVGPLIGGCLGLLPQCGFSTAASGLYAGRVLSLGTLFAVYLTTSDEMLPIMIAAKASPWLIIKLLCIKLVIGVLIGFLIDLIMRKGHQHHHHHDHEHGLHAMCEAEGCACEHRGIWGSALIHTLKVGGFLLAVMWALQAVIFFIGEDTLASLFSSLPVVGPMLSALIGLIPNCASSVLITNLYLEGLISLGCMLSGLLVSAGFGIVVLFRTNRNVKENLQIVLVLYVIGALFGIFADLVGLDALL